MQKIHNRSQVIWYDAVTIQGELKWQNTLNADNQPFFDASDAIFLNYAWKVSDSCSDRLPAQATIIVDKACNMSEGMPV